ncbi:MAG: hypothetical protein KJ922_05390 [Nanoarchaeota archaeon]|nr:hypothetical protein [Nanoarchaeota archaeon]
MKKIFVLLALVLMLSTVLAEELTEEAATQTVIEELEDDSKPNGFLGGFFKEMFKAATDKLFKGIGMKFGSGDSGPSEYVRIGDGKWHDVSCILSKGNEYVGYTNLKWGNRGDASMTIIAAFDSPQKASTKKYKEPKSIVTEEPNMGNQVSAVITMVPADQLMTLLQQEGLEDKHDLIKDAGKNYYKIAITAPDNGYYASYQIKLTSAPKIAFAKVVLDEYSDSRARLHYPASLSKTDKQVTCVQKVEIIPVDLDKKPLDGATISFSSDKKVNEEFKGKYEITGKIPDTVMLSKDINGEKVRNSLKGLKAGNSYKIILASEAERVRKYKDHLTEWGKQIYGPSFELDDYYTIKMTDENKYHNKIIYFDTNLLATEDVESPYHEGMHALWEKTSITNAAGTREDIWKMLPQNEGNLGIIHDNFALDEAQAHLAGYFGVKYYKGITKDESGYTIAKAKDAMEHTWGKPNQVEGVVTTFLVQGYGDEEYVDVLKDMMDVKESYKKKHGAYPMNIGQFLHEKLAQGKDKAKWEALASELGIKASLDKGESVMTYEEESFDYSNINTDEYRSIDEIMPVENTY